MEPQIDYQQLVAALVAQAGGATHKAVSSTPTTTYGHGYIGHIPGSTTGLFSFPGLEPDVVNAMTMPRLGLLDMLPSRTTIYDQPLVGIMTGVTASSGSEPAGVCDDPPVAGLMKLCVHKYVLGRMSRMTRVFDIDRAGMYANRSDFNDLNLIGNPLVGSPNPWVPQAPGNAAPALALRSEIAGLVGGYDAPLEAPDVVVSAARVRFVGGMSEANRESKFVLIALECFANTFIVEATTLHQHPPLHGVEVGVANVESWLMPEA